MSSFTDFERELADRTIKNFDFLKRHTEKPENNIFEVTQLINSLLGIVVSVKESELFDEKLKWVTTSEEWGIPEIPKKFKERDINRIVYHLRNAAAHMNIAPKPTTKYSQIETVTFKSMSLDGTETKWSCVFTIQKLELFLRKLTKFIKEN